MKKESNKLESLANVAIIVSALVTVFAVCFCIFRLQRSTYRASPKIGEVIPVDEFHLTGNEHLVIFALQVGCHYCTESANGFTYVVNATKDNPSVKVIAALPQSQHIATRYVASLGIDVPVYEVPLSAMKVAGTPTVLEVNRSGRIEAVWVGKLDAARAKVIVEQIKKG